MLPGERLPKEFYKRDVLDVAPDMLGKNLVVRIDSGPIKRFMVKEVEAYKGTDDKACHAFKGRTSRTEIMWHEGGKLYVYLIYGMYWMLNIVTGDRDNPQALLIRGVENLDGPGKITRALGIDRSFYGEDLVVSDRIWVEASSYITEVFSGPRIGIDYAGDYWKRIPWRFFTR